MQTSGLVDGHSHLRSTALTDHGVAGSCLEEAILRMNAMTSVDVADDVFVACSDLISSGITGVQFIFHTFGTPDQYLATLARAADGIRRSGIRARVILGITDQYEFVPPNPRSKVQLPAFVDVGPRMRPAQFVEVVASARQDYSDLDLGIGPVGPQWCSDAMLEALGELASEGLRIHTHCLESEKQRSWLPESLVLRLKRHGLLSANTSLAHAIWLDDGELDLVAAAGAQLVTCPRSNRQLKAGRADISRWQQRGIEFAVGLDSLVGRESAFGVARIALDEQAALTALTLGGRRASDLATDRDQVDWSDLETAQVRELRIDDEVIISNGEHRRSAEIAESRARIASAMSADAPARDARQRQLDEIMPTYLAAIAR